MKHFSFLLIATLFVVSAKAQTDSVHTIVETMPQYVGGLEAMMKAISSELQYPKASRGHHMEGTVYVSFVIDEKGTLSDPKVLRGLDPECDAEAVRVVNTLQSWHPGKVEGKPVSVRFVLPIKFKL